MSSHHYSRTASRPPAHGSLLLIVVVCVVVTVAITREFQPASTARAAPEAASRPAAPLAIPILRLPAFDPPAPCPPAAVAPAVQQVQFLESNPAQARESYTELPAPPAKPSRPAPNLDQQESAPGQWVLPLKTADEVEGTVEAEGGLVSIAVREAPLHAVLSLLAK
ncbi:MAG: hypothetical protein KDA37_10575, partial [Planctomycetales bacterium]|nr:hypothetical protein [Planctomycetales bacterium]